MTVLPDGTKEWHNARGERHRLDGPARIDADGSQSWWQDGKLHRTGGPAYLAADGTKLWRINGVGVTANSLIKLAKAGDKETVMRQLLSRLKSDNTDTDNTDIVRVYVDALQAAGIDWPELQTIQRSLRA